MKRLLRNDSHCLFTKDSMNTIGFLNMGQKNIVYSGNISEKAKINKENFSEFPVTFSFFFLLYLGLIEL